MAKVTRILALLTIVALVAALPMSVVAQNDAPHVFIGTAIVNGLTATTGVPITAWDGDTPDRLNHGNRRRKIQHQVSAAPPAG